MQQRMRRRPVETAELLTIARQIAAGLAAAHEQGVVHRDIKAANIIIEQSGAVKILDFGLAKLLGRELGSQAKTSFLSSSGQFFGTLHYLAPEQARGGPADARSDLFAIGVLMYQMASGRLPFEADVALLVLEKIRDNEPDPLVPTDPSFPPDLAHLIGKLLQKDPADRYQSAKDLLQDLDKIQAPAASTPSHHTRSVLGRTVRRPKALRVGAIVAGLLMVVAAAVLVRRETAPSPPPAAAVAPTGPIRSLAVLPLINTAKSERDEFLSVGLADALVTKLQSIPALQVRPTSAVMEFRESKTDARLAGEKLRVDGVLEGQFLAAGNLVRVTLQLTDARTGYSVWADSVDGKRDDLLKLIDDVSARTMSALNDKLGMAKVQPRYSEPRSTNPAAYEHYLKARSMTGTFVEEDYNAQLAELKRAIQLDPGFAAAYADLAIAMSLGTARAISSEADSIGDAETYARQAVRLDPNLPQAHLALGRVFVRYPDRFRESVREVLAALRLNANDTHALNSVVTYFVATGDIRKVECIGERLVRLDPSSTDAKIRGYWYINSVDPEGAMTNSGLALKSKDTEALGHDIRALANILQGNLAEAEREADAVLSLVPRHYLGKSLRAMIAAARGDRVAAEAAIESFAVDANRNHWAAIRVAHVYGKLGDQKKALQWVQKSVNLGQHNWYALVKHPWLRSLQTNPEFQKVLAKIKGDLDDVSDDVIGVYQLLCSS